MLNTKSLGKLSLEAIIDECGPASHVARFGLSGSVVSARTNDIRALRWADVYLAPWVSGQPVDGPACVTLVVPGAGLPDGNGPARPVPISETRMLIPGRHPGSFLVADQADRWVLAVTTDTDNGIRALADGVRDVLNASAGHGRVLAEACVAQVRSQGVLIVGGQPGDRESLLLGLLGAGRLVSYHRSFLGLAGERPWAWGAVSAVAIGQAAAGSHPVVSRHLHALSHFDVTGRGRERPLELTVAELLRIMDCGYASEVPIRHVVWPSRGPDKRGAPVAEISAGEAKERLRQAVGSGGETLAGPLGLPAADHAATEGIVRRFADLPHVSLAGSAAEMAAAILSLDAEPSSDPQSWVRGRSEGRLVCVMHHVRHERSLTCADWRTRAVRGGEVHEFLVCQKEAIRPGQPIQDLWYVGFAALETCLLAVGDTICLEGRPIGQIVGFDDTHLPNHMNIVLAADKPRTGRELGALVGDTLSIHPSPGPRLRGGLNCQPRWGLSA